MADWRREAPIRPVIFEDAGVLTEDTVHLHLEQRVAQRRLARFHSQFLGSMASEVAKKLVRDGILELLELSLAGQ